MVPSDRLKHNMCHIVSVSAHPSAAYRGAYVRVESTCDSGVTVLRPNLVSDPALLRGALTVNSPIIWGVSWTRPRGIETAAASGLPAYRRPG